MTRLPDHIKEIGLKYGLNSATDLWECQGVLVVYHKALERIAAEQNIIWDAPQIVSTDAANDVALIAFGRMGDRLEWSVGEASSDNYPKRGKMKRYPWAMAEKRAKDRVILKLIGLAGYVYSEEESDDFKNNSKPEKPSDFGPGPVDRIDDGLGDGKNASQTRKDGHWDALKSDMRSACRTVDQLRQWWEATQQENSFRSMNRDWRQMFKEEVVDSYREELQMAEAA